VKSLQFAPKRLADLSALATGFKISLQIGCDWFPGIALLAGFD
jgi:hypothetical protein